MRELSSPKWYDRPKKGAKKPVVDGGELKPSFIDPLVFLEARQVEGDEILPKVLVARARGDEEEVRRLQDEARDRATVRGILNGGLIGEPRPVEQMRCPGYIAPFGDED